MLDLLRDYPLGVAAMIGAIYLAAVALALAFHEYSHAYLAYRLGDATAADQGRLTLNPLAHLDLWGTICLVLVGFGWGKPVPVNEGNLRGRWSGLWVSLVGPASNVILAIVAIFIARLTSGWFGPYVDVFFQVFAGINLVLAAFNLIPVPPLDGGAILAHLLPHRLRWVEHSLRRNGMVLVIGLVILMNLANWSPFGGLYRLGATLAGSGV